MLMYVLESLLWGNLLELSKLYPESFNVTCSVVHHYYFFNAALPLWQLSNKLNLCSVILYVTVSRLSSHVLDILWPCLYLNVNVDFAVTYALVHFR